MPERFLLSANAKPLQHPPKYETIAEVVTPETPAMQSGPGGGDKWGSRPPILVHRTRRLRRRELQATAEARDPAALTDERADAE
jgi:hypothetical protein